MTVRIVESLAVLVTEVPPRQAVTGSMETSRDVQGQRRESKNETRTVEYTQCIYYLIYIYIHIYIHIYTYIYVLVK